MPLYWARYGIEGAPLLLVLHGGPGAHHDYLLPQMLALGERYDLLFYDQRGGGRSKTDDPAPITWRTHVEDLDAVVSEFGLTPLSLVGYSWGATLALLYALAAEGRAPGGDAPSVRTAPVRLALVDPGPINSQYRRQFEEEFSRRQRGPRVEAMRGELAASGLRERDPEGFRRRQFEIAVAGYFHDPSKVSGLTPFRVTGRVQQSVWESLGDYDLEPLLPHVKIPTVIAHGRQDPIPLESSEAAARALGARLVVIEESGHVPYVEQPDLLFPALLEFLGSMDAPAGSIAGTS